MIWDEIDSGHNILTYTKVSKMLHGGGATTYFKGTQVSVKLMPRKSSAPQVICFVCCVCCDKPHQKAQARHGELRFFQVA